MAKLAKKQKVLIGGGAALLVLALGVGAYFIFIQPSVTKQNAAQVEVKQQEKLADAVAAGDSKTVQEMYKAKIEKAGTEEEKARLRLYMSAQLVANIGIEPVSEETLKQALQYALDAEAVLKSTQSAAQVARAYYELHDQAKADEYFALVNERAGK